MQFYSYCYIFSLFSLSRSLFLLKWMLKLIVIKILFMGKADFVAFQLLLPFPASSALSKQHNGRVMEILKFLHVFPFSHSQFTAVNSPFFVVVVVVRRAVPLMREVALRKKEKLEILKLFELCLCLGGTYIFSQEREAERSQADSRMLIRKENINNVSIHRMG